ncbi:LemA family protein [Beutenbergia cavernae DSM 12333]|uniref:LemA family protein n=1 Tax=Beutenbergia cavernae (strain ATCC BAA-8 / DSM 12333 / CCUG 43141 / JCM 11478 / NBRC 16432 / NCIMB 13614 / HKI 0122) TaxID=471853 RepID=C5C343_BEUC1|nr:LemA family protein [Beutenbergia cavernae]ACQ81887.1 LemA family protein [Beutenbergia cavernae DSM 12333]
MDLTALGIIGIVLAILVLILLIWGIATYNSFVRLRNLVQEAWRQIDVELHRRYDLIPNLVETVKGYAAHERAVFDEVTRARALAATPGATPGQQAQQENVLEQALGRLFAVAEAYPQLRAAENFAQLQAELTNTEDRIAAGRRFYNANVRELNTKVESFPPSVIAGMFGFRRAEYFEANDPTVRARPSVSFQDTAGNVGSYAPTPPPPAGPGAPGYSTGGPSHGGEPGSFQPGQGGGQPGYPRSQPPQG